MLNTRELWTFFYDMSPGMKRKAIIIHALFLKENKTQQILADSLNTNIYTNT